MNRKVSRSKMGGINPIKHFQAFISVRVPLETLPTNGKLTFDSNNTDQKSNYINSSGNNDDNNNNNNEYKYSYNNDNTDDDNNNSDGNNNKVF